MTEQENAAKVVSGFRAATRRVGKNLPMMKQIRYSLDNQNLEPAMTVLE
jgi:hypothetical protein